MHDRAHPWTPQLAVLEYRPPQPRDDAGIEEALLLGPSAAAERLRERCTSLARSGLNTVFIMGEPGSGKERIAFWLHRSSRRGTRPLALVEAARGDVLEQLGELRKQLQNRQGPGNVVVRGVEHANPAILQALLALLVEQGIELHCGLVLLSTAPIAELRPRSLLHEQLIGRAAESVVEIPPLRTRLEDIPALAQALATEAVERHGRTLRGLSPNVVSRLQQHDFPGNCRELAAIVELAVLRADGDWIAEANLGGLPAAANTAPNPGDELVIRLPGSSLREIELQAVRIALRLASGRVTRAAELLGITRHALRRKLDKFGLHELRRSYGNDNLDDDVYI